MVARRSAEPARRPARARPEEARAPEEPSFAPGFLAAAPLFVAYEVALAIEPELSRNGAEVLLTLPFALLAPGSPSAGPRIALLLAAGALAFVELRRRVAQPWRRLARTAALGVVVGLVLGPLLVLLTRLVQAPAGDVLAWDVPAARPAAPPSLVPLLRLCGGAGWEELVFRVGLLGLLYLLVFRAASFLGLRAGLARLAAEIVAGAGAALAFAAFHLGSAQALLGRAGEPFRFEVFLWRVLAGIALGGIFRWRGLGVAAWAHALLNVGLALGAGTGIFGAG